jgi:hypothetical protein
MALKVVYDLFMTFQTGTLPVSANSLQRKELGAGQNIGKVFNSSFTAAGRNSRQPVSQGWRAIKP